MLDFPLNLGVTHRPPCQRGPPCAFRPEWVLIVLFFPARSNPHPSLSYLAIVVPSVLNNQPIIRRCLSIFSIYRWHKYSTTPHSCFSDFCRLHHHNTLPNPKRDFSSTYHTHFNTRNATRQDQEPWILYFQYTRGRVAQRPQEIQGQAGSYCASSQAQ